MEEMEDRVWDIIMEIWSTYPLSNKPPPNRKRVPAPYFINIEHLQYVLSRLDFLISYRPENKMILDLVDETLYTLNNTYNNHNLKQDLQNIAMQSFRYLISKRSMVDTLDSARHGFYSSNL